MWKGQQTIAPITQPVQGGNVALLLSLAILCKRYEHGIGGGIGSSTLPD